MAVAAIARDRIRVSPDLALPDDAVTRTFVVYGGKGKGKTNFGAVLCEELAKRHLRFCVTDPLDVWWGLQHGKTKGDGGGIDVVILGGTHGDIAITPDAGEVVADFVSDEHVNTVIVMRHSDGRMWSNGERIRFMSRFVRRLFSRQGERRIPLMLVIDEAGRFVPQTAGKGDVQIAECVGAIEELVEWGRNVGLGVTLITQRSARMNKSVSELAECMVAFNTVGPLSVGAIVDWFGEHIPLARQRELIEIVRKLPVGRALVVSPEWLGFEGEAPIRLRETFDSSATPKAGGALRPPGRARKPDLDKYRSRMAETIEKAEQQDPAKLQKRIRELEARAVSPTPPPVSMAPSRIIERKTLGKAEVAKLARATENLRAAADKLAAIAPLSEAVTSALSDLASVVSDARTKEMEAVRASVAAGAHGQTTATAAHPSESRPRSLPQPFRSAPAIAGEADGGRLTGARGPREDGALGPGERAILAAAAMFKEGVDRDQLSVLTGYKKSSRDTYVYKLSQKGLVSVEGSRIVATMSGIDVLGPDYEPPLTGEALRSRWMAKLTGGEREIFSVLVSAYPGAVDRERLSELTDYRKSSRDTYIYKLKARRLVEDAGRAVRASDVLFQ